MKHQLTINDEDLLCIYGLVCSENEIQLCWEINNATGTNLSQTNALKVKNKNGQIDVSAFVDSISFDCIQFMLASNKPNPAQPFNEFKNIDYIFIIKGMFDSSFSEKLRTQLKKIEIIQSIIDIPVKNIKNKDLLTMF